MWVTSCVMIYDGSKLGYFGGGTLQETNISHLGKRKLIFKHALVRDMLVPSRVSIQTGDHDELKEPHHCLSVASIREKPV